MADKDDKAMADATDEPETETAVPSEPTASRSRRSIDEGAKNRRMMGHLMASIGRVQKASRASNHKVSESKLKALEGVDKPDAVSGGTESKSDRSKPTLETNRTSVYRSQRREHELQKQQKVNQREAHFLKTKEEPSILYRPKILSDGEKEQIESQIALAAGEPSSEMATDS